MKAGYGNIGWFFIALFSTLPPILVEHATKGGRTTWLITVMVIILFGIVMAVADMDRRNNLDAKILKRYYLMFGVPAVASYSFTIFLSIIFVNLRDNMGTTATIAKFLPELVKPIFPWIDRFRMANIPMPDDLQSIKIESVMAVWFLLGIIVTLSFLTFTFSVSKEQSMKFFAYANDDLKRHSKVFWFWAALFGIFWGVSEYVGWFNFDPSTSGRRCMMSVACKTVDDLYLFIAAGLKTMAIFGGVIGSVRIWRYLFSNTGERRFSE